MRRSAEFSRIFKLGSFSATEEGDCIYDQLNCPKERQRHAMLITLIADEKQKGKSKKINTCQRDIIEDRLM